MKDVAYIALGSNMGDREKFLADARDGLKVIPDSRIVAESSIEETAPIGPSGQGAYLNQMIALETTLTPHALLAHLHHLEVAAGRVRRERWGPRTLDLDIVKFDAQTVNASDLRVPHPELENRDFWQRELAELRRGG